MSVVVILLMFLAVVAMVKRVDEDRQRQTVLASDSHKVEDAVRARTS